MTSPIVRENMPEVPCPVCGEPMRREFDGVRHPPMPGIFWFCTNVKCENGKQNRLYEGG